MQIDAKQHQHSAAAAAKVILYQSAGELSLLVQYTLRLCLTFKALTKYDGPNVCRDARFFNPFFGFYSAACSKKKDSKTRIPTNFRPFLFREGFSCNFKKIVVHET